MAVDAAGDAPDVRHRGSGPLRDRVRDELRERIADGRIEPGQRLYEIALAAELGVSRLPVREAIRMLESEGMVSVLPRRGGVLVRQLDREDVENLFDVREALEVLAARRAAERADEVGLAELRRLVTTAREAHRAGDAPGVDAANTAFHEQVHQLGRNPLVPEMLGPLTGRLRWLFRQNVEHERVLDDHERLARALADRDAEKAAELALAHIRASRRMVLAMLRDA
ncbi:GntR family transcriptional regulator [Pseudonocardia sp. MH-G8]|uniref:GntR family transcriptional regulator n=1 Tax=Pseudonocardia sp. MH-G8 TaxID=1854588 RepID=UPI000BA154C1|nr:GntR family transcriptional regulator [Pseudonocardia sp. MH-G8]OZM81341.1 GntR family transcriptional regulator [Pseudonocardia sp. MH-G8]